MKIIVGLSGGVDSSVAAYLLKQQGHEVVAVFMKNWEGDDDDEYCNSREDWLDAAAVADHLDIEIEAVNFSATYRDRVFASFLREYAAGRTPNPDILCNSEVKFRAFLDYALSLGGGAIATGHYAAVDNPLSAAAETRLRRALDRSKDQSYFLYRLSQEQLGRAMFPLATWQKSAVRVKAAELGLPTAQKKDSTGICFIGERPFQAFLQRYIATSKGEIVDERGRVIGEHQGLAFYTLGQRKGLGVGGVKPLPGARQAEGAWYVSAKDAGRNRLVVVREHDHPLLLGREVVLEQCHWIAGLDPAGALTAKSRYRQADAAVASLTREGEAMRLRFVEPQWALTPGQSCVVYQGEVCLGGGVISAVAG